MNPEIRTPRPLGGDAGVTLIETIMALVLFGVTMATMSSFMVHQIRAAGTNTNYSLAYELAVKELEDVRAQIYDQIEPRSSEVESGGMEFAIVTEVADNQPAPNMKSIDVAVTWSEPGGERNVTLQTIYTAVTR
jgi:prepilin-type N-terminal cleavage/methylation domain-containing protein